MDATLDICGHLYQIRQVYNLRTHDSGEKAWGRVNNSLQIIELEKDVSVSRLGEALIHEILHAIDTSVDCGLTEQRVQILANCLNQLGFGEHLVGKLDLVTDR